MDLGGSWSSFGVCFFDPLSSFLHCSTHLDTESLNEAWSPSLEGKWQQGGGEGTSAYFDPSLASGLPFSFFLYHACPWREAPMQQGYMGSSVCFLQVGSFHEFCPFILNLSFRKTWTNT